MASIRWMLDDNPDVPIAPGTYGSYELAPLRIPSSVECPYCHEPMREFVAAEIWRNLRILESRDLERLARVEVDIIPASHRMLGCDSCSSAFVAPREGS